jgi:uncharacterized delta-60 repeat protein
MKQIFTLILIIYTYVAAFSQAGTLDKSFNGSGKKVIGFQYGGGTGDDLCYAVAIQYDGKIVLAGKSNATQNGDFNFVVMRLNTDGSLDQSFNGKGYTFINFSNDDEASAVAIQSDGKIVVAGTANASGSHRKIALVRLLTNGIPDISFGDNFSGKVITDVGADAKAATMKLHNGKIIIAGDIINPGNECLLLRYNSNGSLDPSFGIFGKSITDFGSGEYPHSIAFQSDDKIVAGCSEDASWAYSHFLVARFTSNGFADGSFATNGKTITDFGLNDFCNGIAVQSDDKIVAAGFTYINDFDFALARYNKNGTPDNTFSSNGKLITNINKIKHSDDFAYSVAIQSDEKIVVGGSSDYNFALVRYNKNGMLDNSFNGDGKAITDFGDYAEAYAIKIQSNGKIVAAGAKDVLTGNRNFAIARYHGNNTASVNNISITASDADEINEIKSTSQVYVYPNPVTDILHIEGLSATSSAVISITNLSGIIFKKAIIKNSEYALNASLLKPGIYNISIAQNNTITNLKFIKQ